MIHIAFDINLSATEEQLLCKILQCVPADLGTHLSGVGKAALTEYIRMFTGEKVFTRGKDIMEYRLISLIQNYLAGRMPNENEISRMFQTSSTESRTLLKAISSKYQYVLEQIIEDSLRNKLNSDARQNRNVDFRIPLESAFYIEGYNKILGQNPKYTPLLKDVGTASVYIIKNAEYAYLCNHFNILQTAIAY